MGDADRPDRFTTRTVNMGTKYNWDELLFKSWKPYFKINIANAIKERVASPAVPIILWLFEADERYKRHVLLLSNFTVEYDINMTKQFVKMFGFIFYARKEFLASDEEGSYGIYGHLEIPSEEYKKWSYTTFFVSTRSTLLCCSTTIEYLTDIVT